MKGCDAQLKNLILLLLVLLGHLGGEYDRGAAINLIHRAVIMLPSHGPDPSRRFNTFYHLNFRFSTGKPMKYAIHYVSFSYKTAMKPSDET